MEFTDGTIVGFMKGVRDTIALTEAWQAWTESPDAATAADRVFRWDVPNNPPAKDLRPFALLRLDEEQAYDSQSYAEGIRMAQASVLCAFEANVPSEYVEDTEGLWDWFMNRISAVLTGIEDLQKTQPSDVRHFRRTPILGYGRTPSGKRAQQGDYVWLIVAFIAESAAIAGV